MAPATACLFGACVTFGLTACAQHAPLAPPGFQQERADSLGRQYRLGVGDRLRVTVFDEPDLSGEFAVNASGQVALPLIGPQQARGKTLNQFIGETRGRYSRGFLKNPRLNVEVLNYRPIFVHGEVRAGGQFDYKDGLRIRDAIAVAGGYTYRADKGYVLLARGNQPLLRVNLNEPVLVLPGDNIRVPERFF